MTITATPGMCWEEEQAEVRVVEEGPFSRPEGRRDTVMGRALGVEGTACTKIPR